MFIDAFMFVGWFVVVGGLLTADVPPALERILRLPSMAAPTVACVAAHVVVRRRGAVGAGRR